ncbi:MAG: hypothetical protein M3478_10010 [Planctomycetota bacterium]|nr:hypothetical protein [Planctomycetota bacterium]
MAAPSASLALILLPSCARVRVDPIEVKPIHIVHDINIRVDRQLDEFFAFQEKMGATTQPATTTAAPAQTAGAPQGVTP